MQLASKRPIIILKLSAEWLSALCRVRLHIIRISVWRSVCVLRRVIESNLFLYFERMKKAEISFRIFRILKMNSSHSHWARVGLFCSKSSDGMKYDSVCEFVCVDVTLKCIIIMIRGEVTRSKCMYECRLQFFPLRFDWWRINGANRPHHYSIPSSETFNKNYPRKYRRNECWTRRMKNCIYHRQNKK